MICVSKSVHFDYYSLCDIEVKSLSLSSNKIKTIYLFTQLCWGILHCFLFGALPRFKFIIAALKSLACILISHTLLPNQQHKSTNRIGSSFRRLNKFNRVWPGETINKTRHFECVLLTLE
uniref:(northern house mosquito) hypothetical protein n=1 Tax=Culex pipiens TaxID=7175 RepID=A0A8D8F577_CULPI